MSEEGKVVNGRLTCPHRRADLDHLPEQATAGKSVQRDRSLPDNYTVAAIRVMSSLENLLIAKRNVVVNDPEDNRQICVGRMALKKLPYDFPPALQLLFFLFLGFWNRLHRSPAQRMRELLGSLGQ